MFESTELFLRGIGETTDVVTKEMYTFEDRGGRSMTLRPENTASVVRAFLEHKLYGDPQVHKFYYMGPMFRHDRPQAGRYRQFTQFGVEEIGYKDPAVDAEIIAMAFQLFRELSAARNAVLSIARSSSISLPINGISSATTATNGWKRIRSASSTAKKTAKK